MSPNLAPPPFLFIPGTSHGRSKKDVEVQHAKARSHAAKVAYRRKNPEVKIVPGLAQALSNDRRPQVFRLLQAAKIEGSRRLLTERSDEEEEEERNEVPFSDYSCSTGLRVDPFFCIDGARDKSVAAVIDFCGHRTLPRYDVLFKVFNVIQCTDFFMNTMASDPAFYHVSLAATQTVLDSLHGVKPSRVMLHHRGLALSNLRKKLAQDEALDDPSVMCTILFLALLERPLGNQAGFTLHRNNLIAMLSSERGSRSLQAQRKAKALIMQYDSYWALASGETMFPAERASNPTPPMTILSASQTSALINSLPEGLQQLAKQGNFSLNTMEILSRAAHACRWSGEVGDAHKPLSPAPRVPSYNDFLEACPCLFGADSRHVSLEKLALLTVLVRIFLLDAPRMLTSGLIGARVELSRQVFLYEPTSQPEQDFIIWVVTSTVEAWHFQDPRLHGQHPRALVTEFLTRYPDMRDLGALRRKLARFFGMPWDSRLGLIHQAMMQHATR